MASRAYIERDSGRVYEFGPFRLDEDERSLSRDGEPVALTPKVFDTLLLLVQSAGHLVDKDELMKSIWPDSFVEEANLNRSISTLRRALREAPNDPRYIETVPKRGYRFIAQVTESPGGSGRAASRERVSLEVPPEPWSDGRDVVESGADERNELPASSSDDHVEKVSWSFNYRAAAFASLIVLPIVALVYFTLTSRSAEFDKAAKTRTVGSLAVLPFQVLGATEQDQTLELGMTDVLITTLSNIKEINVRPTSAVLKYSNTKQSLVEIGRSLKVDTILEGSVQKVDDRIRVTVRLMDMNNETPLWAAKFDEPAADILKVQESIADRVARALLANLLPTDEPVVAKRYTSDRQAYEFYLKGRYFWNKRTTPNYDTAVEYYWRAIAKDPNYALAYAGLADAYSLLGINSSNQKRIENYEKAKRASIKALEIDEGLAEVHTSLGWIKRTYEWDWPGAEREFKRAIELNPNSANAHQWYALLLISVGRSQEAIAEINRAQELDPVSWVVQANAFSVFFRARQFDQAITHSQQQLELDPTSAKAHIGLALSYLMKEMYDEAISEMGMAMSSDEVAVLGLLARAYDRKGQKDKSRDAINSLEQKARGRPEALFHLATVYADLGESDRAFECLQEAYRERDERLVWIKLDPRLDSLRSDPRFDELLRKMNLAP